MWENGIYWHYLSSWCQPDSINSSSEEWMRLWALSGGIVPLSCLLLACLPLSVMKTFLLMAGVQEAKPILQYLMAALQILCSPCSTVKPLFFPPPSKHAFNQLLDLVLKSGFRDLLMKATKKHIPSQALKRPCAVDVVYKAYSLSPLILVLNLQSWTGWNGAAQPWWHMKCLFLAEYICGNPGQIQQITQDGWT